MSKSITFYLASNQTPPDELFLGDEDYVWVNAEHLSMKLALWEHYQFILVEDGDEQRFLPALDKDTKLNARDFKYLIRLPRTV